MTQKQIDAELNRLQQRIDDWIYKHGDIMEMPDYDQILSEILRLNAEVPDEQPYTDAFEQGNDLEE